MFTLALNGFFKSRTVHPIDVDAANAILERLADATYHELFNEPFAKALGHASVQFIETLGRAKEYYPRLFAGLPHDVEERAFDIEAKTKALVRLLLSDDGSATAKAAAKYLVNVLTGNTSLQSLFDDELRAALSSADDAAVRDLLADSPDLYRLLLPTTRQSLGDDYRMLGPLPDDPAANSDQREFVTLSEPPKDVCPLPPEAAYDVVTGKLAVDGKVFAEPGPNRQAGGEIPGYKLIEEATSGAYVYERDGAGRLNDSLRITVAGPGGDTVVPKPSSSWHDLTNDIYGITPLTDPAAPKVVDFARAMHEVARSRQVDADQLRPYVDGIQVDDRTVQRATVDLESLLRDGVFKLDDVINLIGGGESQLSAERLVEIAVPDALVLLNDSTAVTVLGDHPDVRQQNFDAALKRLGSHSGPEPEVHALAELLRPYEGVLREIGSQTGSLSDATQATWNRLIRFKAKLVAVGTLETMPEQGLAAQSPDMSLPFVAATESPT